MNIEVNFYFDKAEKWQEELRLLRNILLDCGLTEVLKWGVPSYTYKQKNIVLIHQFKEYCAILFFKGVLLKDSKKLLVQQTKNVQAARQLRFKSEKEILQLQAMIKAYVFEAIELEKAGVEVSLKKTADFEVCGEFSQRLAGKDGEALQTAFDSLSPGRQRAYLLYFSSAKQSKTREARVQKHIPRILDGRGLHEL